MKLVKTFADVAKIVMWAESPVEDDKSARLQIGLRDGNPRIAVYTGGKGKESMLNFPMSIIDTVTLMNVLKDIANGAPGEIYTARSQGKVWKDDKPTNEVKDIAKLHIGKNKEGITFLSVTMEGRPKIVFPFKLSPFMLFQDKNQQPVPEYVSTKMAIGLADLVLGVCTTLVLNYTQEEYANGTRTAMEITGNDSNGRPTGNKSRDQQQQRPAQGNKFEDLDELSL